MQERTSSRRAGRIIRAGCAFAALLWTTSIASADEADIDRGRALADRLCAVCHLNAGQGEKQGATGVPGFRAIANRADQTRADVVRWLQSAPPMMPNHHLTSDEMEQLAAFILSLRGKP